MGGAMVINIIGNLLLVPKLGIMGAAVAALFTFVFLFGSGWVAAMRLTKASFVELVKATGGFFVAGAAMAVVVIFLKDYVYWMLTIPVGALVYVGMSFLTRALTLEHLRSARTLINRPKYAENPAADN
jgi:O-antigen/teichoic acid export membrane protein